LTISATTTAENGNEYEAVFTNGSGSATTNPATLTVIPDVASVITTQPVSQTVPSGQTVTFTAAASGDPTPTVQRQLSFDHGSTWLDTTLTSPSFSGMAVPFANGWEVRAVFTNYLGTSTSTAATMTVAPSTTVAIPANNATVAGTSVVLDATATPGANSVLYQLSGGSLTNHVIATATPTIYGWIALWNSTSVPNGTYTLQSVASYSGGGSGTSPPVAITVNNPPPSTTVVFPVDGATYNTTNSTNYFDATASPGVTQVQFTLASLGFSEVFTATPTIYGWIAVLPEGSEQPGGCGPVSLPVSIQSEASYSGGVTGTSAPVNISIIVWVPATSCG
jgi:hypothetical protein